MGNSSIEIGNRIKKLRKYNNISQKELGKKLGVKNNTISAYERGRISPGIDIIIKMSEVFNCSISDILDIGDDSISSDWKHFIKNTEDRGYTPYKISKILDLYEKLKEI